MAGYRRPDPIAEATMKYTNARGFYLPSSRFVHCFDPSWLVHDFFLLLYMPPRRPLHFDLCSLNGIRDQPLASSLNTVLLSSNHREAPGLVCAFRR